MSYDIDLIKDGRPAAVPAHAEGGTYVLGGTDQAQLNVTYNYSARYAEVLVPLPAGEGQPLALQPFSVHAPQGQRAEDTIPWLEAVVAQLGTEQDRGDYWAATPGNAGYAASILLAWARLHPDGIWEVC